MINLGDCRAAIADALRSAELNVSDGGDLVPNGALIGAFVVNYHPTIAGGPSATARAGCEVRVMVSRADEGSAYSGLDAVMTTLWQVLEQAPGPWHALIVSTARPDGPTQVGEASYQSASLVLEVFV
jgi:hypothetical protein